jgi:hypothetical protein
MKPRAAKARPRKFTPDNLPLTYTDDVAMCIRSGQWIYLRGVPKHPSIFANMTFRTIASFIDRRMLFIAKEAKR